MRHLRARVAAGDRARWLEWRRCVGQAPSSRHAPPMSRPAPTQGQGAVLLLPRDGILGLWSLRRVRAHSGGRGVLGLHVRRAGHVHQLLRDREENDHRARYPPRSLVVGATYSAAIRDSGARSSVQWVSQSSDAEMCFTGQRCAHVLNQTQRCDPLTLVALSSAAAVCLQSPRVVSAAPAVPTRPRGLQPVQGGSHG